MSLFSTVVARSRWHLLLVGDGGTKNIGRGGVVSILTEFLFKDLGMDFLWSEVFYLLDCKEGVGDVRVGLRKLGEDCASKYVVFDLDAIEGTA